MISYTQGNSSVRLLNRLIRALAKLQPAHGCAVLEVLSINHAELRFGWDGAAYVIVACGDRGVLVEELNQGMRVSSDRAHIIGKAVERI